LTAYALGELAGDEHAADRRVVEALLAKNAEARAAVEEIRATAGLARAALGMEVSPGMGDALREEVLPRPKTTCGSDPTVAALEHDRGKQAHGRLSRHHAPGAGAAALSAVQLAGGGGGDCDRGDPVQRPCCRASISTSGPRSRD